MNIPPILQEQGIASEIFRRAILEYEPDIVRGLWIVGDIYEEGQSVNLKNFRGGIAQGLTKHDAVFRTPTGKILSNLGFNKIEIIADTEHEVIVHFLR